MQSQMTFVFMVLMKNLDFVYWEIHLIIPIQNLKRKEKINYKKKLPSTSIKVGLLIYISVFEQALKLLSEKGKISFITPNFIFTLLLVKI